MDAYSMPPYAAVDTTRALPVYLTVAETAELLAVHQATIRRWIRTGLLPAYHVGGLVRIRPSDVETFGKRIPHAGGGRA